MATFVALLRGINVGGRRSVPMAGLRDLFAEAGARDVRTYIQSGNVVFGHTKAADALRHDLERRIEAATGHEVTVVLRTARQLATVVAHNPFPDAKPSTLHVGFLNDRPAKAAITAVDPARFAPEAMVVVGRELYLHLPNGMGRAKLPPALAKLRTPITVRNWKTVTTLADMAGA